MITETSWTHMFNSIKQITSYNKITYLISLVYILNYFIIKAVFILAKSQKKVDYRKKLIPIWCSRNNQKTVLCTKILRGGGKMMFIILICLSYEVKCNNSTMIIHMVFQSLKTIILAQKIYVYIFFDSVYYKMNILINSFLNFKFQYLY